jgi:hypothetical protein
MTARYDGLMKEVIEFKVYGQCFKVINYYTLNNVFLGNLSQPHHLPEWPVAVTVVSLSRDYWPRANATRPVMGSRAVRKVEQLFLIL